MALLCGATAPPGYADKDGDCCDLDPRAYTGQTEFFTAPDACGSYDYNCDGYQLAGPQVICASCVGQTSAECNDGTLRPGWCPYQGETEVGTVCLHVSSCEDAIQCGRSLPYIVSGDVGEGACTSYGGLGCEVVIKNAVVETRTVACR